MRQRDQVPRQEADRGQTEPNSGVLAHNFVVDVEREKRGRSGEFRRVRYPCAREKHVLVQSLGCPDRDNLQKTYNDLKDSEAKLVALLSDVDEYDKNVVENQTEKVNDGFSFIICFTLTFLTLTRVLVEYFNVLVNYGTKRFGDFLPFFVFNSILSFCK